FKLDLKMKLTIFSIVVSFFQLQAITFYGQNAKVSLNVEEVELGTVLKSIERQTDYRFFYNIEDIDARQSITLKVKNRTLKVVLQIIFKDTPIEYTVVDNQIVLGVKKELPKKVNSIKILQQQVKGLVTDSNGIPIPGVTILIKGTSKGTFTNDNGEFNINASPTDILILTYIGFKTLEVSVGNSSELSLVLQEDVTSLDEVTVNAGYYTVKERERTGSISRVTAEEIELQPVISPIQ